MDIRRCFKILDLSPEASTEEIKRQYRDLVNIWHPDRFGHSDRLRKKAEDKLTEINGAYDSVMAFVRSGRPDPTGGGGGFRKDGAPGEDTRRAGEERFRPPPGNWATAKPKFSYWKLIIPMMMISMLISTGLVISKLDRLTSMFGGSNLDLKQTLNQLSGQAPTANSAPPASTAAGGKTPARKKPAQVTHKKFVEIHLKSGAVLLADSYTVEGDMILYRTGKNTMGLHKSKVKSIGYREANVLE